jgi:hypothetical protein
MLLTSMMQVNKAMPTKLTKSVTKKSPSVKLILIPTNLRINPLASMQTNIPPEKEGARVVALTMLLVKELAKAVQLMASMILAKKVNAKGAMLIASMVME